MSSMIVAPVVVMPDIASNHASTPLGIAPESTNGTAPTDAARSHVSVAIRRPSRMRIRFVSGRKNAVPRPPRIPAAAAVSKNAAAAFQAFAREIGCDCLPNAQNGDRLSWVPNCLPPLNGIKVLRSGLHMGALRGKLLIPDHALALACPMKKTFPLDAAQAAAYLHGDTLPWPEQERGYCVVSYQGYVLGFGKASDGQLKNHYPKGLRRP